MSYILIKTTFPSVNEAEQISLRLLEKKLIACAQINEIKSLYQWEGKIVKEKEALLEFKTRTYLYVEIEEFIRENHPYRTPQIIAVPISDGMIEYLDWIDDCTVKQL